MKSNQNNTKQLNDIKPFEHGSEGTHGCCQEILDTLGGKATCCECTGHKCKTNSPGIPVSSTSMNPIPKCYCCNKNHKMEPPEERGYVEVCQKCITKDCQPPQDTQEEKWNENIEKCVGCSIQWKKIGKQCPVCYTMKPGVPNEDTQEKLECKKHSRILIGKTKCVDCEQEKQECGKDMNVPSKVEDNKEWSERFDDADLYETIELDPTIGDGPTHTQLSEEKVKSFIASVVDEVAEDCLEMINKGRPMFFTVEGAKEMDRIERIRDVLRKEITEEIKAKYLKPKE